MTTAATAATSANQNLQNYLSQQAQNIAADKTAAANTAATGSSSTSATTGVFKNETTFLNILTEQLKHQDPTAATDTNQFTQELVQFAGVEQQLTTNNDLQSLINLQKTSSGVTADLGYVGQYVEAPTTDGKIPLQSSAAEFAYSLPSAAQSVTVTIKDSSGNTVTTLSGPKTAGLNYLSWNGQDTNGVQQPDGTYSFSVSALDTSGKAETISDLRILGKVTGVSSNSDGTTNLSLGDISIGTSTVDSVYSAGNLPQAPAA